MKFSLLSATFALLLLLCCLAIQAAAECPSENHERNVIWQGDRLNLPLQTARLPGRVYRLSGQVKGKALGDKSDDRVVRVSQSLHFGDDQNNIVLLSQDQVSRANAPPSKYILWFDNNTRQRTVFLPGTQNMRENCFVNLQGGVLSSVTVVHAIFPPAE